MVKVVGTLLLGKGHNLEQSFLQKKIWFDQYYQGRFWRLPWNTPPSPKAIWGHLLWQSDKGQYCNWACLSNKYVWHKGTLGIEAYPQYSLPNCL